jgi:hypothetical protein
MLYLINAGSVEDIKGSLKNAEDKFTITQLRSDLIHEKHMQKRSTVIQLLVAAIARKLKKNLVASKSGVCKICLCTEDHACPDPDTGTCFWVESDLCSACANPEQKQKAIKRMTGRDALGACLG